MFFNLWALREILGSPGSFHKLWVWEIFFFGLFRPESALLLASFHFSGVPKSGRFERVRRNTQMSANDRKRAQTQVRERAPKRAKER